MESYPSIEDFFLPGEPAVVVDANVLREIDEFMERESERISREEALAVLKSREIVLNC